MKTKAELPDCPVATTVSLIGSKWKLLILRNLLQRPWRFNELKKSLDGISQKVLTDSLRSMEEDGIITRTVYPEVPPRVEYALSDLGESMRPIIMSMNNSEMIINKRMKQNDLGSVSSSNDTEPFYLLIISERMELKKAAYFLLSSLRQAM